MPIPWHQALSIPGLMTANESGASCNVRAYGMVPQIEEGRRPKYPKHWLNRTDRNVVLTDRVRTFMVRSGGGIWQRAKGNLYPGARCSQMTGPTLGARPVGIPVYSPTPGPIPPPQPAVPAQVPKPPSPYSSPPAAPVHPSPGLPGRPEPAGTAPAGTPIPPAKERPEEGGVVGLIVAGLLVLAAVL